MHSITHWEAKRSGPAITITGLVDGKQARITAKKILSAEAAGAPHPVAVDGNGKWHELA